MPTHTDHHLVELLLEAADGTDEEIVQIVNRVGIQPALEVVFGELLLDLDGLPDGQGALRIQHELNVGPIVLTHLVSFDHGEVRVDQGGWRSGTSDQAGTATAHITVTSTLLELVALFRAALGAEAAADRAPARAVQAVATGARDLGLDWHAQLERRAGERGDLKALAVRFGADKWGVHYYTGVYERYLRHLRGRRLKILEIGVGGYGDPASGGASLQMWKRYFPRSLVFGLDVADKSGIDTQRLRTVQLDQGDSTALNALMKEIGPVDLVIDDGSHVCQDQITSFKTLFPHLAPDGFYLIEDLQTSYWPGFGGNSEDLNDPATTTGFLKALTDGLNYEEILRDGDYTPADTERHIVGIHFFHSLAVIEKGVNAEGSAGAFLPDEIKRSGLPRNQGEVRPDQW